MPFFWRKKVVLARIEATCAATVSMTGAANAMLVKDLKIMPMEGQDIERGGAFGPRDRSVPGSPPNSPRPGASRRRPSALAGPRPAAT